LQPTAEDIKNLRGLTLIELILSLGLVALTLTAALAFFSAGQKAYQREDAMLYAQQNVRQAFLWLSTSLRQARSVQVLSEREIRIIESSGEQTTFYFQNGVLYRRKNSGTNPIAELSELKFYNSKSGSYVEMMLTINTGGGDVTIKTKVTPFGFWINQN